MKIIESDDEVLKVYDDGECIWLEFEDAAYPFSPLEAQKLCESLLRTVNNSSYFKGFSKENNE